MSILNCLHVKIAALSINKSHPDVYGMIRQMLPLSAGIRSRIIFAWKFILYPIPYLIGYIDDC